MNGQTADYLEDFCNYYNINITSIKIFEDYINELINNDFKQQKTILNLDYLIKKVKNRNGTHWVAVIHFLEPKTYKKQIFWFDSYGIVPHSIIIKICKEKKYDLVYNNIMFQSLKNEKNMYTCGLWCAGFLGLLPEDDINYEIIDECLEYLKNFYWEFDENEEIEN